MKYDNIKEGRFISRPNRFIAIVDIDGVETVVHVKNTGRCRELLIPGCTVYLEKAKNPERKTPYDLIAVKKGDILINMDSQVVNRAAEEWILKSEFFSPRAHVRREVTRGNSRFDLYIEDGERKAFLEVKGVTLEKDGRALFPDAPTLRGVKHLNHLVDLLDEGYEAFVLFVIQMKGVKSFSPHDEMHREFGSALRNAAHNGVRVLAYDCKVTPDTIEIDSPVRVEL